MKKSLTLILLICTLIIQGQVIPVSFMKNSTNNTLFLYLDANTSYIGSGVTWSDISGRNNTATFNVNPTFNLSPKSFTFASNVNAATINNIASLSAATFIAWVNPSQTQGSYSGIIFNRSGKGTSSAAATGINLNNGNYLGYHWNDQYNLWYSGLNVPNNEWSMVAITITSTTAIAYLCNASGIASATNTANHVKMNNLNFFVGCDPFDYSTRAFIGKIATSMIYNTTLSSTEITAIFNLQKATFGF